MNEATTRLSCNTKGWVEVFVDVAASHVKILERKVRRIETSLLTLALRLSLRMNSYSRNTE